MTDLALPAAAAGEHLPATPTAPALNPYDVYLNALQSPESRRTMKGCLDRIAQLITGDPRTTGADIPWERLRYEHTSRIRALMLERGWSPAHVNKHLVALRRVLKEAWRLGLMTAEQYQRAADLPPVKAHRLPAGAAVPRESLAALLRTCQQDDRVIGRRDAAIVATLYSTGCRCAELVGLTIADYSPGDRSLRVRGKGDKERLVYLNPDAVKLVEEWLAIRGWTPGALFPVVRKGGQLERDERGHLRHMTPRALGMLLDRRFQQAKVARRSPHDFRRTFIGDLLDAGVDLATVQAIVGHSSPATTARYDRRPERRRRDAVDRLTLPKL